mmetsp:Transcript_16205/g.45761  ORF Transcript_16205/g.45761 Transcript_16205/m.45761 type:complete len:202 (+) Transcript_16205:1151-1756(+)
MRKVLEHREGWLVDGTDDSLSLRSAIINNFHDFEGCEGVQAGGGLVEKEDLTVRHNLNSDRYQLPSNHSQLLNHIVRLVFQTHLNEYVLNSVQNVLIADIRPTSGAGAKEKSLLHGSRLNMNVHLLHVSTEAVQITRIRLSVELNLPRNTPPCLTPCNDVQKCGFPGTRGAHQCNDHSGLRVSRDIAQKMFRVTLKVDFVG